MDCKRASCTRMLLRQNRYQTGAKAFKTALLGDDFLNSALKTPNYLIIISFYPLNALNFPTKSFNSSTLISTELTSCLEYRPSSMSVLILCPLQSALCLCGRSLLMRSVAISSRRVYSLVRLTNCTVASCKMSDFLYLWLDLGFGSSWGAILSASVCSVLVRRFMEAMCDLLAGNMDLFLYRSSGCRHRFIIKTYNRQRTIMESCLTKMIAHHVKILLFDAKNRPIGTQMKSSFMITLDFTWV